MVADIYQGRGKQRPYAVAADVYQGRGKRRPYAVVTGRYVYPRARRARRRRARAVVTARRLVAARPW